MQFNRDISFTASWKYTGLIGAGMAFLMIFIQVFLQPFDTFLTDTALKSLKLSGYGGTVFLTVNFIHIPELYIYRKQEQKWTLLNEVMALAIGFIFMGLLGYLYHSFVFGEMSISFSSFFGWTLNYALPFAPLFIPLWAYLRYRFSQVTISHQELSGETLIIEGQNSGEKVRLKWSDFVLATVDSNYLDIFVLNDEGTIEKHVLRGTLSSLVDQLPKARQVHRSYLVNTSHIEELSGNSRKGAAILNHYPKEVPISPKHFTALKEYLQSRP